MLQTGKQRDSNQTHPWNHRISQVGKDPQESTCSTPGSTPNHHKCKHYVCPGQHVLCPPPSGADPVPNPPLTQLHTIPSGPVSITREQSSALPHPVRSCSRHEASPQLLCSGLSKPRGLSCSSHTLLYRPFTTFIALLWLLADSFISFLHCGT